MATKVKKSTVLSQSKYGKLLKDIRNLIEEGKAKATRAAANELVKTYWNVGKRISEEGLLENAGYGEAILEDLSDELKIDLSTLKRSIYFFQTYKSATSSTNLTWSHYKYLLSINNTQERSFYKNLADEEEYSVLQLSNAIKEDKFAKSQKKGKKSASQRSEILKRPTQATYVYKALVDRVIDGDTLLLRIDLGFAVFKEQRIRLAGIDCPPMDEKEGKDAYTFVRDTLAQLDFVMVKTNKIDIYGRYIGHIFYSPKLTNKDEIFSKGAYLNQELLNQNLARMV